MSPISGSTSHVRDPCSCEGHPRVPVADAALAVLVQCESFVASLTDHAYAACSRALPGGTVGKHVRHSVDHFDALVRAHALRETVDYDRRERGTPMESDRAAALQAVRELRARITRLSAAEMNTPVRVRVMLATDGAEAELFSTLGRELAFAAHHAVHHHAMMKAIAAEFGCTAPREFGKAPSTLAHEAHRERPAMISAPY